MISQLWKTHRHAEAVERCPLCGEKIKWIYIEDGWAPCDEDPVLFILHPAGKDVVIYKGRKYECAMIYKPGMRFAGVYEPLKGYRQHYYTCAEIKEMRKNYAIQMRQEREGKSCRLK